MPKIHARQRKVARVTFRLSPTKLRQLRLRARKLGLSPSSLVRHLVEIELDNKDWARRRGLR